MKTSIIVIAVILVVLLFGVLPAVSSYNKMVKMDQNVKESWAQVENVYKRRMDLIPNLVNTVKGAANFEQTTLTKVIEARAKATQVTIDPSRMTQENLRQFQDAQGQLSSAMSRLMVSVERYPDLKANQSFMELQSEIEGTENRIATERRKFNEVTGEYNTQIKSFPSVLFASMFNFKEKPFFTAGKEAEIAPTVQF